MVQNSDNHLESSSSREEVSIVEAEHNIVQIEDLNDDTTAERENVVPQPAAAQQQQNLQRSASTNFAAEEATENLTRYSNNATVENQSSTDEDYDDEPEESLGERIMALAEIFPEPVREMASKASVVASNGASKVFHTTCRLTWVISTSALILLAPIAFESERSQMQELQKMHEKSMLFGPNTVVAPSMGSRINAR